jgi:hypothetical protein
MRQISVFFLAACIFSCKGSSSSISMDNEKLVRSALIGKWESAYLETSASRMEVPKEMVAVITYEANGTYNARKKGGVIANTGNWSYNPKTHRLNNSSKGVAYDQRIVSLTDKELVLTNYTFSNDQIVDSTIETYKKL